MRKLFNKIKSGVIEIMSKVEEHKIKMIDKTVEVLKDKELGKVLSDIGICIGVASLTYKILNR